MSNPLYMGGQCDNKEGDLNSKHPIHMILEYKRRSDMEEGDITKVRVCLNPGKP